MFLTEVDLFSAYERDRTEILVEIVKYRLSPYLIDIKIYAYSFCSSECAAPSSFFSRNRTKLLSNRTTKKSKQLQLFMVDIYDRLKSSNAIKSNHNFFPANN